MARKPAKTRVEPVLGMRISDTAVARAFGARSYEEKVPKAQLERIWALPKPMPGVLPANEAGMAQDSALSGLYQYQITNSVGPYNALGPGFALGFLGYPYLAQLAQVPEFRNISETLAREMTRKWVKITANNDEKDKSDKVQAIEVEWDRLGVQHHFRRATELDGDFGIAHIFLDFGEQDAANAAPLTIAPATISQSKPLRRLKIVEPVWTYPRDYNASDALSPNFYKPQSWAVQSKVVHATRLLTLISREVPDILKPAYAFGGMSMTQIALDYVKNWRRTQRSISRLVDNFSQRGIKTNLDAVLNGGGGEEVDRRAQLYTLTADNFGLMVLGEKEEFFNISTPLGGLSDLQAQAQEQMASVTHIPLVKLLGISPKGLNATAEPEIRVFYDWIESSQEQLYRDPLKRLLDITQLSLFGEIDPDVTFRFEPLWQLDSAGQAALQKTLADLDAVLITAGIISPDEARRRVANDEFSGYHGLEGDAPEPADPSEEAPPGAEGETDRKIDVAENEV